MLVNPDLNVCIDVGVRALIYIIVEMNEILTFFCQKLTFFVKDMGFKSSCEQRVASLHYARAKKCDIWLFVLSNKTVLK